VTVTVIVTVIVLVIVTVIVIVTVTVTVTVIGTANEGHDSTPPQCLQRSRCLCRSSPFACRVVQFDHAPLQHLLARRLPGRSSPNPPAPPCPLELSMAAPIAEEG